jgi:hypothetical protein
MGELKREMSRYRRDVLKGRSSHGKKEKQGLSRKGKRAGWDGGRRRQGLSRKREVSRE